MEEDYVINKSDIEYKERLGSGVCGDVYRVVLNTRPHVGVAAAKVFKATKSVSDLKSQIQEVNFLRKLNHPNIVKFYCAVLYPVTIIVTEYASKGSLYEYLKFQLKLPVWKILKWSRQATLAVQHLQRNNVVHRDIKSSNFVINAHDVLKLCDFGLAKTQCLTVATTAERGTIRWMAPEAFVELVSSKSSDVFSLGIVIWELVTCDLPYAGKEDCCVLYSVKVLKLRPEIPAHCPAALKHLLGECWKENRKERPSIDAVLRTIVAAIERRPYQCSGKLVLCTPPTYHCVYQQTRQVVSMILAIPHKSDNFPKHTF